ncbi:hypothetical protein HDU78_004916 [Chytriomyces hyalinus]|nr:hypothetical protein HDU78_004916 [Chytriomyces hyalinus]
MVLNTIAQSFTDAGRRLANLTRASAYRDANEREPLLSESPAAFSSPPVLKGKCWCCWESAETRHDPLIRVCLGCRDPDLQWVHQSCMDRYLSNLPPRPPSASTTIAPPALASTASDIHHLLDEYDSSVLSNTQFFCTRCNDPYYVIEKPVSRITSIFNDRFLGAAMCVMIVCISTLTVCCVSLMLENWGTGNVLFDWELFENVHISLSIVLFAFLMLVLCHVMNGLTVVVMLDFVKGRVSRQIQGIPVERLERHLAEQDVESGL